MLDIFENEYYKKIKENLSMIVLIPTILGGIRQILQLGSMGIPYIRFFSITQLIPDGIIVLIFLGVVFFAFLISSVVIKKIEQLLMHHDRVKKLIKVGIIINLPILLSNRTQDFSSLKITISIGILLRLFYYNISTTHLNGKYKKTISIVSHIIITVYLTLLGYIVHKNVLPGNFTINNINKIEIKGEIIYFNDKYVFLRNKEKEVNIIKIDEILTPKK